MNSLPQLRAYYLDLLFAYDTNINNGLTINPNVIVRLNLYKNLHQDQDYYFAHSLMLDRYLWWILAYVNFSQRILFYFGHQAEIGNAMTEATHCCQLLSKFKIVPLIFYEKLLSLWQKLPNLDDDSKDNFITWWKENGEKWLRQLKQLMIKYRDIGHNWQFTEEEKTMIKEYYYANQLLIECLNINYSESDSFWQEMTKSLFLPIAEIEKRQQLDN